MKSNERNTLTIQKRHWNDFETVFEGPFIVCFNTNPLLCKRNFDVNFPTIAVRIQLSKCTICNKYENRTVVVALFQYTEVCCVYPLRKYFTTMEEVYRVHQNSALILKTKTTWWRINNIFHAWKPILNTYFEKVIPAFLHFMQ